MLNIAVCSEAHQFSWNAIIVLDEVFLTLHALTGVLERECFRKNGPEDMVQYNGLQYHQT